MSDGNVPGRLVTKVCQPCLRRNSQYTTADKFCADCGEYQCLKCIDGHQDYAQISNHKFCDILETSTGVAAKHMRGLDLCKEHMQTFGFYCEYDKKLFCIKCLEQHKRCNWGEIENISMGMEIDLAKVQNKLTDIASTSEKVKQIQAKLDDLESSFQSKIKDMQDNVHNMFEKMKESVAQQMHSFKESTFNEFFDSSENPKDDMKNLIQTLAYLNEITEHVTSVQKFIVYYHVKEKVNDLKKLNIAVPDIVGSIEFDETLKEIAAEEAQPSKFFTIIWPTSRKKSTEESDGGLGKPDRMMQKESVNVESKTKPEWEHSQKTSINQNKETYTGSKEYQMEEELSMKERILVQFSADVSGLGKPDRMMQKESANVESETKPEEENSKETSINETKETYTNSRGYQMKEEVSIKEQIAVQFSADVSGLGKPERTMQKESANVESETKPEEENPKESSINENKETYTDSREYQKEEEMSMKERIALQFSADVYGPGMQGERSNEKHGQTEEHKTESDYIVKQGEFKAVETKSNREKKTQKESTKHDYSVDGGALELGNEQTMNDTSEVQSIRKVPKPTLRKREGKNQQHNDGPDEELQQKLNRRRSRMGEELLNPKS